jgi:hypothetical protein
LRGHGRGFFQQRRREAGVEVTPACDGARFLHAQPREVGAVGPQFRGRFDQHLAAGIGAHGRPCREGLRCGIAGRARIVGRGRRRAGYDFPRDGALAFESGAIPCGDIRAADMQLDLVHDPVPMLLVLAWKASQHNI